MSDSLRFETPFLAEKFIYLLRVSTVLLDLGVFLRKAPCFKAYLMGDEVTVLRVLCRKLYANCASFVRVLTGTY